MNSLLTRFSLPLIYSASAAFTVFVALTAYINSSFLIEQHGITDNTIGSLYIISAAISGILLILTPRLLHRISPKNMGILLLLCSILFLLGMVSRVPSLVVIGCFILLNALVSAMYLVLDIFVEHYSRDANTGSTRGIYYTLLNIVWVVAPLATTLVIAHFDGYIPVYYIGIALSILALGIFLFFIKNLPHTPRILPLPSFFTSFLAYIKKPTLRRIGISSLLLQGFYAVMVIYSPLYLHTNAGISWEHIGIIFGIMLIPFPLIQAPLGRIADKFWGEKELLIIGFIIMSIATAIFAVIHTSHWWVWAIILLITRIGAAVVEIMNESYFFKHVGENNLEDIGIFRLASPLAYIIGPLAVTPLFLFGNNNYQVIFLVLAIVMVIGVVVAGKMRDTK